MNDLTDRTCVRRAPTLISVVIPARNEAATIGNQLQALAGQEGVRFEVIVADNGSTDGTAEVVRGFAHLLPSVRVVDASRAPGINVARNAGAGAAAGDFLVYCDADDVVHPGWLNAMAAGAMQGDVVCGRLEDESLNTARVRSYRRSSTDRAPLGLGFLPYAVGNNMGVWKAALDAVGGWDEDFIGGGDDLDLSFRLQLAGYSLAYSPDALVAYRLRGTLGGLTRQQYRYGYAGPLLYKRYRRHGATRRTFWRALRTWVWLVANAPRLLHPDMRGAWLCTAAFTWGRLRGCLRWRTLYW